MFSFGARGIVGEVEVEHDPFRLDAEIRALDRIVKVAPAVVGGSVGGRITEREKNPAAVRFDPVAGDRSGFARGFDGARLPDDASRYFTRIESSGDTM
jgi:hypothetical protein